MSRLTLKSGEPVTGKAIYYKPYHHARVALWYCNEWHIWPPQQRFAKLEYLKTLARQRGYISPRLAKRIRKAEGK